LGPETDSGRSDPLREEEPLLAELYGASVCGRIATGPRAGRNILRLEGESKPAKDTSSSQRCYASGGYSVHAGVSVPARDRARLERLARYALRPPIALQRLSLLKDGRLLYRLKRHWSDGTSHVIYEPLELLERLAALIPPPRFNIIRYSGVLAPRSAFRPMIVPQLKTDSARSHAGCLGESVDGEAKQDEETRPGGKRQKNYCWAQLMSRVFEVDVLACPRCGGRMRILAAIDSADAIEKILACLDLPTRPPPVAAPRLEMDSLLF
jgi:hypothetical protein